MNYKKVYDQIIFKAKSENRKKYTGIYYERHHIKPRCLNGDNLDENLVNLTAREHFLSHWLLCRIYPDNSKLANAFWRMCNSNGLKISSRIYSEAKEKHCQANSKQFKGKQSNVSIELRKERAKKAVETRKLNNSEWKCGKGVKRNCKTKPGHSKGHIPWNKGKTDLNFNFTEESRKKISIASKNKTKGKIEVYKYPSMEFVDVFFNTKETEKELGVSNINAILNGRRTNSKGYTFKRIAA